MAKDIARLLNVGLRFGTLGIRFLLIFFLARFLDAESIGYYGIFTATVGYALYIVGMDYYVYVTREILATDGPARGRMLKGQVALSSLIYLLFVPLAVVFLAKVSWPGNLIYWFLPILLFEHFNQEVFRLLVAMSRQLTASMLLFIRQGSWALIFVGLAAFTPEARQLEAVMMLWAGSGLVAALLGVWAVRGLRFGGWKLPVDWAWVRRGAVISGGFLVATLALRGLQTIDRYWLEHLAGIEVVGAYVLFAGMSGALMVFLDAGIFTFTYPALITHHNKGEVTEARARMRAMAVQTVLVVVAFAVVSILFLPLLLRWVGNPFYQEMVRLYPWVLAAIALYGLGMVPHYGLYAQGRDRPLIVSHIGALAVFVVAVALLQGWDRVLAVPAGLVVAFLFIFLWKGAAYLRTVRRSGR